MGAILNLPKTYEQRIEIFSEQIQRETEGEYSVLAMPNGYVELQYKGQGLIQVLAQGKTYKKLYEDVCILVRAFVLHQVADAIEQIEKK